MIRWFMSSFLMIIQYMIFDPNVTATFIHNLGQTAIATQLFTFNDVFIVSILVIILKDCAIV